jgi:hypothetical protein
LFRSFNFIRWQLTNFIVVLECDDHLRIIVPFVARLMVLALNASQSETNQLICHARLGLVCDFIMPVKGRSQLITKESMSIVMSIAMLSLSRPVHAIISSQSDRSSL